MTDPRIANLFSLAARILLAAIFISAGWGKLMNYAGSAGYMAANGVPGALLPLVIITELGFGLMVLIGFQTRIFAFLLGGFCLLTALMFHFKPADQMQMTQFLKNVAIAGGFLALVAFGPGAWSLDRRGR